jgi:hypothetical protein
LKNVGRKILLGRKEGKRDRERESLRKGKESRQSQIHHNILAKDL